MNPKTIAAILQGLQVALALLQSLRDSGVLKHDHALTPALDTAHADLTAALAVEANAPEKKGA